MAQIIQGYQINTLRKAILSHSENQINQLNGWIGAPRSISDLYLVVDLVFTRVSVNSDI